MQLVPRRVGRSRREKSDPWDFVRIVLVFAAICAAMAAFIFDISMLFLLVPLALGLEIMIFRVTGAGQSDESFEIDEDFMNNADDSARW